MAALRDAMKNSMSTQGLVAALFLSVVWAMLQAEPIQGDSGLVVAQWYEGLLILAVALTLIGTEAAGKAANLRPRARILATALSGADPTIMLTGPAPASRKALAKAGLNVEDIDLFEINEAFAAVAMRYMKDMGISHEQTNVNGGAIAMGHPLGATGAMILGTLIDELERRELRYGLATLCVGGGMGIATIVERV